MKIGIYDPYLDDLGGGEKYMASIASCLVDSNHNVTLFWDNKEDVANLQKRFSIDFSKITVAKNIFSPQTDIVTRLITTNQYDVIIVLSDGSIPLSLSKKLILHLQQPLEQFNGESIKEKFKLSRVTSIFCNSEYTKSFNEKRFKIKTSTVYPPVRLAPRNIKKQNIILTVGRFRARDVVTGTDDYKKFPIILEGFKSLIDKGLDTSWRLVIAISVREEDEDKFTKLEREARGFPIEFLVNLPNDDLWEIYSKAKIYWHAAGYGEDLKKHPERAEHFGISTVEAMGAGAVPVVINAGGQREIVTNGENGFLWDTLDELRDKTNTLITDKNLWEKFSENAKKRAHDFSPDRFCEAIQKLVT